MKTCRVCRSGTVEPFASLDGLQYWRCRTCEATLLDPAHFPARDAELTHYRTHDNRIDDPGYRAFLDKLAVPLRERLPKGASGLDYGCGPGPALARMLEEHGFAVALYDPFFAPDMSVLTRKYDFITCTETAEHFHDPAAEFEKLMTMVCPGGVLAIMTSFQTDDSRFPRWRYRLDPTHVVFYRESTLRHLASQAGWHCEIPDKDLALMHKPDRTDRQTE
jgi:hypothetical protein